MCYGAEPKRKYAHVVETVFIPQSFFLSSFSYFFQTPETPLHARKLWWRGSSSLSVCVSVCVCVLYIWTHSSLQNDALMKPCPGIMQNSTDTTPPPFHVPETPCMIPKNQMRKKERENQNANYNNKDERQKVESGWGRNQRKRWTCSYHELDDASR